MLPDIKPEFQYLKGRLSYFQYTAKNIKCSSVFIEILEK